MRPIPSSVQSEIFRKYLEGYSIPAISKLFNVSVGAVSTIANEVSKKDAYFIVIREVTKMFKNNNLEISDVISAIRLKNKVKESGLTISFFENFLEATNTESFRLNKDHSEFLENI
ncbi:MAG: Paired box domain, partial [Nitrososphaeraceae archaeon]|nr:Paired box domain [Nitrososphaeraceae archaeon]